MRLCPIRREEKDQPAGGPPDGIVPVAAINNHLGKSWPEDLYELILRGIEPAILTDAFQTPAAGGPASVRFGPLSRRRGKILGIGLNYRDHAADLNAPFPTEPASFMKCDN